MSKTGDAVRLSAPRIDSISLETLIGASRRLDELGTARVIGEAAEVVHKSQQGGRALGTLAPPAIWIATTGRVTVEPASTSCGYTAPERLRGSPGDRRSDVFTLGVLLWEALAHERLFDGPSEAVVKTAVLAANARLPSECNANVPAELDAICKKALALDPADRYQSAKVMAAEIAAVLDDAGYPESNDEIARYVTAALAAQTEVGVPLPSTDEKTEAMEGAPAFMEVAAPVPIPVKTPLPAVAVAPRPKNPTPSPPPAVAALANLPVSATGTLIGRAVSSDGLKAPNDRKAAPLPRIVVPPKPEVSSEKRTPKPEEAPLPSVLVSTPEEAAVLAKVQWHDGDPPAGVSAAATIVPGDSITPPSVTIVENPTAPREAPPAPAASAVAVPPKSDMLGGWGWGTGAQEAIEDEYYDGGRKTKKRLVLAIGGSLGAVLMIVLVAVAAGGGSKRKEIEPPGPTELAGRAWAAPPAKPAEPAVSGAAPTTAPTPAPAAVTPAPAVEPPKTEPAAPKTEPAAPKTEPAPPAPPLPAPAAVAKAEPPKSEPPKVEPPKPAPPKPAPPPKPAAAAPKAKAVATRAPAKPIDPYGEPKSEKLDANTAYKTGLQQFARGDSQAALATFKASLTANPDFAPTWRGIGLVYEKLGERSRARTAFQRYLKLAPTAGDASQIRERLDRL